MRVSAAVAIAVALPALLAGTVTGILLRPDPPPPPRPRPAIRSTPATIVSTTPPPPPAATRADNPDEKLLAALCRGGGVKMFLPADQIPKPVVDAVREQLHSGTADQKLAILRLIEEAGWFSGADLPIKKEEIIERATAFLADNDPRLRAIAVPILQRYAPQQADQRFDVVQELWRTSRDPLIRATCIDALGQMTSPEARQLLLKGAAQVASDPEAMKDRRLMGTALGALNSHAPWLPPEEVASICASALRNTQEPLAFQGWAEFALRLPLPRATTLLEQARDGAPTAEIQAGAKRALEQIRAGETRADRLVAAFRQPK